MKSCGAVLEGVTVDGEPLECWKHVEGHHRARGGVRFVTRQTVGEAE